MICALLLSSPSFSSRSCFFLFCFSLPPSNSQSGISAGTVLQLRGNRVRIEIRSMYIFVKLIGEKADLKQQLSRGDGPRKWEALGEMNPMQLQLEFNVVEFFHVLCFLVSFPSVGRTVTLNDVYPFTSIEEVKSLFAEKTGIPPYDQSLIYNGRRLEDGRTLGDVSSTNKTETS